MNPANGFWAYIHRKYYPLKHWRHITIMILNSQFYFFFISKQTFIKLLYSAKVLSFSELMGKFFSYFSLSCLQNIVEEEKRLYQNRILFFFLGYELGKSSVALYHFGWIVMEWPKRKKKITIVTWLYIQLIVTFFLLSLTSFQVIAST